MQDDSMEYRPGDFKSKLDFNPKDVINRGGFDSPERDDDVDDFHTV